MNFELISPSKEKWNDFVDNNNHSDIFQKYEMADVYNKTRNMGGIRLAVSDGEGKLLACMVVKMESKGFLKSLTSISIIENAPLYEGSEQGKKAADFLIKYYDIYIKRKALYTIVKTNKNKFLENLYKSNGYKQSDGLNFEINLDKDVEGVFKSIHKSRRKNIRRSEKKGVTVIEAEKDSLPGFYGILKETYDSINILIPDTSYFNETFNLMPNSVKLFLAKYQNTIIAGRIVLFYKHKVFDWYAGASSKYLGIFPNDILVWHVLEWGCKNGFKLFDFGGAGVPEKEYGVREFKRRFGGQLVKFSSFKKIHRPLTASFGAKFFSFYRKILENG